MTRARTIAAWWAANRGPFVQVAGNMGILTAQRVVQRVAGLVSLYFVVRHLSPADLGHYQFATVALVALAFFALPGLDNALMQSIARGSGQIYRRATGFSVSFSLLGSVALVLVALALRPREPEAFGPLLATAALFAPYTALVQWKSVLIGRSRFVPLAAAEGVTALLTHGGLVAAVMLDVRALWVFVLLYLAPTAVMNVLATALCLRTSTLAGGEGEENEGLFRYGLQASAVTAVSMIAEQIERLIIFLLIGPAALAIYLAGDRLSELVRGVFQDAAAVLAARFARMATYQGRIERAIWVICVAAGVTIILFAFTLAPTVLLLIFGPAFQPSIPYAQALLCSVAIGNVGQFQFRFIRSQVDGQSFRTITLWTSGFRIVGSMVLVGLFGVWGAVASVVGHRLVLSLASSVMIRTRYRAAPASPTVET
ncbi:oligosaccharide flippase family protein [Brevundimonas sp.]|uniref:oligosaccharide flippase family protein n=1 Tax=Brevundimonas sp. TaxID=1871086 RepID=UPI00286A3816|nr:oligosaccharide flippase family protein [Brevundimonas sp.]